MSLDHFNINNHQVHADSNEILTNGKVFKMTPKEIGVLKVLFKNRGKTVTRFDILESVWGTDYGNDTGLTQAISRLRKVFNDNPKNPKLLKTIPKIGYKLTQDPIKHQNHESRIRHYAQKFQTLPRFQKFIVKAIVLFIFLIIFLMIFDIRIRIEEL